jgi:hypothetical protein
MGPFLFKYKMNRLAVILIGQYRTWPICAPYLQNFFASKTKQVDYFFVTWNKTGTYHNGLWSAADITVTEEDILQYFKTTNVVCKMLPEIPERNTYYKMAYLAREANKLKLQKEQEENFIYNSVVETRPDLFLAPGAHEWSECKDLMYYGDKISVLNGNMFIGDTYLRTSSETYNIVSNRIAKCTSKVSSLARSLGNYHHKMLANYLQENNVVWAGNDFYFQSVIRNPLCATMDLNALSIDEIIANNPRKY